eukprot:GGOE01006310.1.p2 GENE.GGOE01006310.1~~GGOE01006310.1.p2  ORF type:complete len:262 (-),score=80.83 GGOE01006310.1:189-884(-)
MDSVRSTASSGGLDVPTYQDLLLHREELQQRCLAQEEQLQRLSDFVGDHENVEAASKLLLMLLQVQNSNLLRRLNQYRRETARLQHTIAQLPTENASSSYPRSARVEAMNVAFSTAEDSIPWPQEPTTIEQCRLHHAQEEVRHALHRLRGSIFGLRQDVQQSSAAIGVLLLETRLAVQEGLATLELQLDTAYESIANLQAAAGEGTGRTKPGGECATMVEFKRGDFTASPR